MAAGPAKWREVAPLRRFGAIPWEHRFLPWVSFWRLRPECAHGSVASPGRLWERPGPQAALLRPARGRCRLRPQRARPLTVSPHPCARRSLGPRKVSVRTFQEFGWLAGPPEALSSVRVPTPENDESELLGVDQGASASSASAWPRRSVPGGLEDGPASSHPSPHPGTPPRGRRSKICPRRERAKPPPRDGYPLSRLTDPSIGQSVLREPFAR